VIDRHKPLHVFLDEMHDQMANPYVEIPGERATVNPLADMDDAVRMRPAQALLRAWALVGDVLTFYQQRIAEESVLSTAREDFSAYAIARTVGYEPRPVISATTSLAFSVLAVPGSAGKPTVTIPKHTAVGNIPDPGKLPAIFETSTALEADPAWNLFPCAFDDAPAPAKLRCGTTRLVLEGGEPIPPGTALAIRVAPPSGPGATLAAIVAETTDDPSRDATLVRWQNVVPIEGGDDGAVEVGDVLVLDTRFRPFGALARPFAAASPVERRPYALGGISIRTDGAWIPPWIATDTNLVALAIAPSGVYAITSTTLIRHSSDGGWSASSPFPGSVLQTILATPDGRLAVGTTTGQVFISIDDGLTWLSIGDDIAAASAGKLDKYQTRRLPAVPVRAIAIDESAEVPVVFVATDRGVAAIPLNGEAWTWRNDGLPGTDAKTGFASAAVTSLTFADAAGTLLAATTYGVYRSVRAQRWSRVQGLGAVSQVASLPGALVAAGPGGVFRSTDDGSTWEKAREIAGLPRCLAADVATVAVAVGNDVYTSDDSGATWVRATNPTGAPIVAVAVGSDGTVAAAAPLVDNPSLEWPDLLTMITGNTITLERESVLTKGDVLVVSLQDDDRTAEAYVVAASSTSIVVRFGMSAMCTTVTLESNVNPLLAQPRQAIVHAGARVRNALRVKREAPAAPRFSLPVPRGLPKLERKRRIAIEGRPARVMLRGTAGGTLRLAAGVPAATDPLLPYVWPAPEPRANPDPDYDVAAAAKSGDLGAVVARFDGVWSRDDVTSLTSSWIRLPPLPIAVTGLARRGETLYACGLGPLGRRSNGVYEYRDGAWSDTPVLVQPVHRLVVTGAGAVQTLWACGKRGLCYQPSDGGAWHSTGIPFDDRTVRDVAADADATTVLAACDDGVYARRNAVWSRVPGLDGMTVSALALGGGYWYAGTRGAGTWRRGAVGSGRWERFGERNRSADVRRLFVCADGTVFAAVRGLGVTCDGELLPATLASNVRAFVPYATDADDFVLAFAGGPLCPTGDERRTAMPMRRRIDCVDITGAERLLLDAGMLPGSIRSRVEKIVNVKLDGAELVVENAGETWRLRVSDVVPIYLLRRGPAPAGDGAVRVDLFEVRRFELESPAVPFDRSNAAVVNDDAVCRWRVRGAGESEQLLARPLELWNAPARSDAAARSEIASVALHEPGALDLRGMLRNAYDPRTVSVAANVVEATHGATIPADEVIASGDSSQKAQTATLSSAPLTNVLSNGAPKAELDVWVSANHTDAIAATEALASRKADEEAVRWYRVRDFVGSGSNSRDYVARQHPDGSATLTFGDGDAGRRLPSGTNNVVARYRIGGGSDGNLAPNRLSLFQAKFSGADRVRNPVPATGGVDSERVADLRANMSRGLVALDRVVSRLDLEDYVRAWPGVAKVNVAVTDERAASFVVTYASRDAIDVNAVAVALRRNGAAGWHVALLAYRPRCFVVEARLLVEASSRAGDVLTAARQALLDAFSFDARSLREGVQVSTVIALVQRVRGVNAVVLDALYESGTIRGVRDLLGDDADPGEAASLLTLDDGDVRLTLLTGDGVEASS
jgi:hypothetical protein